MRLLTLADACRDAGLDVEEVDGWSTRGSEFSQMPSIVVAHHTASASTSGDMPSLGILISGRSDLPGPLCQVGLSRSGRVYVIAAGKANHAGPGAWAGFTSSEHTIGIEAENNGVGEAWPTAQRDAYDQLAATLLRMLGRDADLLCGHKEWALPPGRKIDPTLNMDAMRARVRALLEEDTVTPADIDAIATAVRKQVLGEELTEGLTVRVALRRTARLAERTIDMVEKLADGDGAAAKQIAVAVRKELAEALLGGNP